MLEQDLSLLWQHARWISSQSDNFHVLLSPNTTGNLINTLHWKSWNEGGFDRKQHKLWLLYVLFSQHNFSVMVTWRVSNCFLWAFLTKDIVLLMNIPEETRICTWLLFLLCGILTPIFLKLSGLMVIMSPVMGDAVNVEFPVTAEVTNTQYFADFSPMLFSPLVCIASFSNLIFIFSHWLC